MVSENKETSPLVTVCVQTYQHASYLRECLDSIIMQKTDFPFEINLGEDESTDGTREICIEYANNYPDIINLFLNERRNVIYINGHPTGRWNLLNNFKNARGKYIALCPGDDYWTDPHKLQKQIDFLEANPDFVICCHNTKQIFENNPALVRYVRPDWTPQTKDILTIEDQIRDVISYHSSSVVFRNGLLKLPGFFQEIASGDIALFTMLAQFGKIKYLDEVMSTYRKNASGISHSHIEENLFLARLKTNNLLNEYFEGKYIKLYREINEGLYNQLFHFYIKKHRLGSLLRHSLVYLYSNKSAPKPLIQRFSAVFKVLIKFISQLLTPFYSIPIRKISFFINTLKK